MRSRKPLMLLLIVLAIGGAYVYQNGWQMPKLGTAPANGVQSSGSLESRSVALTAEVGGQISELKVSEGALVEELGNNQHQREHADSQYTLAKATCSKE